MKFLFLTPIFLLSQIACSQTVSVVAPDEAPRKLGAGYGFTEGPAWDAKTRSWIFSDIPRDTLHRVFESGFRGTAISPSFNTNGNAFDAAGHLISCQHGARRVAKWDGANWLALAEKFEGKRLNSPNDLAIFGDGSIYFTDPTYGVKREARELDFQGVFRLFPDGKLVLLDKEWTQPNGICFSPDGKRLYIADSQTREIFVYDVNARGEISGKRRFATVSQGVPDGMKCDENGLLLVGIGGGVAVYSPAGAPLEKIEISSNGKAKNVANLGFGGAEGKTLLMTAQDEIWSVKLRAGGAKPAQNQPK